MARLQSQELAFPPHVLFSLVLCSPNAPLTIEVLRLHLFPLGDYSTWELGSNSEEYFLLPSHKDYFLYLILLFQLEPG